jgi:hypothetical protein
LLDRDVGSLDELRHIVDRFIADWGITDDSQAKLDAFYADAETSIAARGEINQLDLDGFAIHGTPIGPVDPGLAIRIVVDSFSTYTSILWDPLDPSLAD